MKKKILLMINALFLLAASTVRADVISAAVSGTGSKRIIIAVLAGALFALIITAVWKAQLKSVRKKHEAGNYVRRDSLNLRINNDRFLYTRVTKTPIPKQNDSKTGTGGTGGKDSII